MIDVCKSDKGLGGDPQLPVIGLPDCSGVDGAVGTIADIFGASSPDFMPIVDPGLSTDDFEQAGIPVPENYSAPGYTGLEEDIDVHLQAVRLGEIFLPICSCEQWWDQSRNIELRTDKVAGDETLPGNLGYDTARNWGPVPVECWLIAGALYVAGVALVRSTASVRQALGFSRLALAEATEAGTAPDLATAAPGA